MQCWNGLAVSRIGYGSLVEADRIPKRWRSDVGRAYEQRRTRDRLGANGGRYGDDADQSRAVVVVVYTPQIDEHDRRGRVWK